ncbi:hypothetical protein WN55_08959 [Dufourea novaeangliae]|uniref:Uncharacterized protein n=1 Tax=Dufourea novaeangliae TaxID=178035 RepID=A0A154P4T1_DUFNO|nr:hypothetical protein WN55_08959 [Dufourea novaeangliae]
MGQLYAGTGEGAKSGLRGVGNAGRPTEETGMMVSGQFSTKSLWARRVSWRVFVPEKFPPGGVYHAPWVSLTGDGVA